MRYLYLALACPAILAAAQNPGAREFHARIPMRDGIHLAANIFVPAGERRFPTILERTPYNKGTQITPNYQAFVNRGYAVVVEDVRGRYESEGTFDPLRQEGPDGDDTLNWIARQPWSDGKIGMTGGSYRGIVQWKAALTGNPHLKAIFPVVSGSDDYRDRFYSPGGAMKLGQRLEWMAENLKVPGYHPDFHRFVLHLPLMTADVAATGQVSRMFRDVVAHPAYDSFWRGLSVAEQIAKIRVPVFTVGGWYDNFVESDLAAFASLHKASGLNRILIGPWPHNMSVPLPEGHFGPEALLPIRKYQLEWFDQWLMGKDTELLSQPPVEIFVMGVNQWRQEREWPPAGARPRRFYLTSGGHANSAAGDGVLSLREPGRETRDEYTFDPRNPVPTRGGAVCCNPKLLPWGPMDQRPVEQRRDVLVYTSPPLDQDLEAIGPVQVVLYVSSSALDTDFTAKLVDVAPDGYARNLTDGILRMRYRNSASKPQPLNAGEVYKVTIDAGVTGNVFLKGHCVRLEISSSNFPRFDRNPNTGGPVAQETRLLKASQTVYHGGARASRLVLMVVPGRG
ncbi:MAG TPA: CocE/NonD family hydrolase [Bryobacteraceae bacterium]|nr:CocE/NonD family hydrolase [Bryobacteraceae bacterium]